MASRHYFPLSVQSPECARYTEISGVCPMRALLPPSRARGRIWASCVILTAVASAGLAAAGPAAVAAPAAASAPTAGSHSAAAVAGTPTAGQVTWSLLPATSTGPDSRNQFDYGNVKP